MNNILTQEYLFMIGPTAVLSLALAAVAISYVFLLMKLGKSEKDKVFLQSRIRDQASEVLKDAHEKRLSIIQEATQKAHTILKDTQTFTIDVKTQLSSDLEGIRKRQEELVAIRSEEITKLYEEFSANLRRSTEGQFKATADNMENKALQDISEFSHVLESEKIFIHKELGAKIEEEYKKTQKDINEYKMDQMKKLDKQIFDIIHALTRDVLGRSLTIHDHEDLIQKALVQMKTDINSQ